MDLAEDLNAEGQAVVKSDNWPCDQDKALFDGSSDSLGVDVLRGVQEAKPSASFW
jgi:hypothetical protein